MSNHEMTRISQKDIGMAGLAKFPPEFRNHYDCPDCGKEWTISARVIRDDDCPRCGSVSLPTSYQESER